MRRLEGERATRFARILIGGSGVAIALIIFVNLSLAYGRPGDVLTYLAAGERLNAGHDLYALQAGDRSLPIVPPYWTVPLLSPPLVGVLWRPLATLPEPVAIGGWWVAMIAALAAVVAMILLRPRVLGAAAVYVLAVPIGLEAVQGNINAIIMLGAAAAWRLFVGDRVFAAGVIAGFLAVLKITPAVFAVWAIASGGLRGLAGVAVGVGASMAVALLGSGVDDHVAYLAVMRDTTTIGPSDMSLPGLLRTLGLDPALAGRTGTLIAAGGALVVLLLRKRPDRAYQAAAITIVIGSPVVYINTFALLLLVLLPVLWPLRGDDQADHAAEPAAEVAA